MKAVKNQQPANTTESYGGSNKKKGSNSPSVTVKRIHQPGKTVQAGGQK